MKLDLGGGRYPREGHVNVDVCPGADVHCDLDAGPLPFPDESVEAVFSSHCLEHVADPRVLLWEIARVCKVGASVEIRVPHFLNPMALSPGHRHVLSVRQFRHWTDALDRFAREHWGGRGQRRLRWLRDEYVPSMEFDEIQALYPDRDRELILRWAPGAAHELIAFFEVVQNEFQGEPPC
jgi:SAM-dependent methyltransferase